MVICTGYHVSGIREGDIDDSLWWGDGDLLCSLTWGDCDLLLIVFPSFTSVFNFVKCDKALQKKQD